MTATAAPRSWKIDLTVAPPEGVQLAPVLGKRRVWPYYSMEVGQSHLTRLPDDGAKRRVIITRIQAAISKIRSTTSKDFATKEYAGGIRVWRVA
jgi:hypothetical protein